MVYPKEMLEMFDFLFRTPSEERLERLEEEKKENREKVDESFGDLFLDFDLLTIISIDRGSNGHTRVRFIDNTLSAMNLINGGGAPSRINFIDFKTSARQHNDFVAEYIDWVTEKEEKEKEEE